MQCKQLAGACGRAAQPRKKLRCAVFVAAVTSQKSLLAKLSEYSCTPAISQLNPDSIKLCMHFCAATGPAEGCRGAACWPAARHP